MAEPDQSDVSMRPVLFETYNNPVTDLLSHLGDQQLPGLSELQVLDGQLGTGVVHLKSQFTSSESKQVALKDLEFLQQLKSKVQGVWFDRLGSESDYAVLPVILERPESGADEAADHEATVLKALHVQPLQQYVQMKTFDSAEAFLGYMNSEHLRLPDCDDEKEELLEALTQLVQYAEPPYVEVIVGDEDESMWQPKPVFWLARSPAHRNLVGLMTGVVWT